MSELSSNYEFINSLLPDKCRGCISAVVAIRLIAGPGEILDCTEADELILEIDKSCSGYEGDDIDFTLFTIEEDASTTIPIQFMLNQSGCSFSRMVGDSMKEYLRHALDEDG